MEENFKLLKPKNIIAILIGDTTFEKYNDIPIGMPYMSGPMLCDLSKTFGLPQEYSFAKGFANLSRWQYFDNLLDYCITQNKTSQLLSYMISKERFTKQLSSLSSVEIIEETYDHIIKKIMEQVNAILYFGGNKLSVIGKNYLITKIDSKVNVEVPNIKIIDREYIKQLSERALQDIEEQNMDSAITKARTILEETFCYAIELKNEIPSDSGDIGKLYKQVKDLYNMHSDKNMDVRINKILSGLEKIVSGITELRNNGSDSHGLGIKRINISDYHARFAVNSAVVMAEFILSVSKNNK